MFYLIRAKTATSAISVARANDLGLITSTILDFQHAGFSDVAVLDSSGREIAFEDLVAAAPVASASLASARPVVP